MSQPDCIPTPADREELRDLIARSISRYSFADTVARTAADVALSTLDKAGVVYGPRRPTPAMNAAIEDYAKRQMRDSEDDAWKALAWDILQGHHALCAASPYAPEKTDA